MLKGNPIFLALGAAALILAGCSRGVGEDAPSPSLLLVTLDTVRADRIGSYGYGAAETPWLDRLAGEGVRFAQASAPAPLTLPSHSSLLSGLLPPHHGLRNNGIGTFPDGPDSPATLATLLAGEGYRTGAFVGSFVLDRRFGLARGFEVYDDEIERDPGAGTVLEAERPGREVVDRALAWLGGAGEADASRPFFLWVHLYDAHAPYTPPSPYRERHAGRPYDGEIAAVDEQVGRLLQELERRGLADRTVVAVAADHGEGLGEHGESTHGLLLYESTLRVPLLLRSPGVEGGRVVRTPVGLADVAPTLAGLLGKQLPSPSSGALDGRDLSASLREGEEPPPSDLYAETQYPALFGWSPLASLRRRDLKYIAAPEPELYDLTRDPGEADNLAAAAPSPPARGRGTGSGGMGSTGMGSTSDRLRGFAGRLAEIEAGAVEAPRSAADAETRARLASLGYAAGGTTTAPRRRAGDPTVPDPKRMVRLFERFERAHARIRGGGAGEALAELQALVAADPRNPVFRGELGRAWREQGEMDKAVPLYRQAAEDAPDDPEAWYNLAATLQEAGRPAEAREAIRKAMHLDPARPEAHNTLGILLLAEGRPEQARQEFELAVSLDPRDAAALNNLGNVLRGLGRFDEAERSYRQAAALAPRYAEPLNGLGTLEVERDRPAQALSYFDRALRLAPGYHEVRLNRGIAHEIAGQAAAAAAAYRDFLAATGGDPQFAEQRRAARMLLARIENETAITPGERR